MTQKTKYTYFNKNFFYVFTIILVGLILRYYYFTEINAWFDEWNILYTVDPNVSNEDTWKRYYGDRGDYYILPEYYPPLYAFLLKLVLSIFGYTAENSSAVSLIFGSGSLVLVFCLTRIISTYKISLITTILVSFNLFLIWQSSEIRPHSFVVFFSLLNIIFFFKLFEQGNLKKISIPILYVLFSVILVSSWPFALIIFFGKFIFLFHDFFINKKKNIYIFFCIIVSLVIYIILNYEYLIYHLSRDEHYTKLYINFFYSYHFRSFFGSIVLGAIFLILFSYLSLINIKKIIFNSNKVNLLFFIIISSYFLTIIYSILGASVISPKYVIFILPLIIIWMTIKIEESNIKFKNHLLLFLVFGSLLNCIIYFYDNPIERPPTKKVLEIISNSNTKRILTTDGTVFANFISTNKMFINNNLSIDNVSYQGGISYKNGLMILSYENGVRIETINLNKNDFWFLCLNNPRFAVGKNILPDLKQCKFLDDYDYLNLEKEIRLPDYLLKKYSYR